MQLDTLREFADLAASLNFTKTARERFMSQSVLSKHIGALERELGIRLFDRTQHKVELTEAGALLYKRVRPVLASFDKAVDEVRALDSDKKQLLRLGYLLGVSKPFLGAGYGAFCLEHQDITLELVLCEHGESFEVLEGGDVDIIMTAVLDMKDTQGYCFSYLYEDGFGALMHRSHRLAECGSLSLDDLTGERIGVMESRHSLMISPFVVNELEERGLGKPVRLPAADINSIPVVAAADVSNVVIVPLHLRLLYDNAEQVVVPLRDGRLKQTICMLWKPERESPALLDLVESMKREAARSVAERA